MIKYTYRSWMLRFGEQIDAEILIALKNEQPLTLGIICKRVNIQYLTAKRHLKKLEEEHKVISRVLTPKSILFFLCESDKHENMA
jgi:DNA-binding transcriptional ArsR family regulator